MERDVIVIGGGPAGLAVGSTLSRAGMTPVILERTAAVGSSWRGHYDRLRLHTIRQLSQLPEYKMSRGFGKWVARDRFITYLEEYARDQGLDIRFRTTVGGVEPESEGWRVETSGGDLRARWVVVATGYNHTPYLPDWPDRTAFPGEVLHSSAYRNPEPFAGKDVLVVGTGNSGAEIAVDLVEGGARGVWVSVRTPPNITGPQALGLPNPIFGVLVRKLRLPVGFVDGLGKVMQHIAIGDLSQYGLAEPARGVYSRVNQGSIPLIDTMGFVAALKRGAITVVPEVMGFSWDRVLLAGGTRLRVDAVIAATGYRHGLEKLVGKLGLLNQRGLPIVHGPVTHQSAPGLYFIGFTNPISGNLREIAIDARAIAQSIKAEAQAPALASQTA